MPNRAPGSLVLVQDFVNTIDLEEAKEQIGTPQALRVWLAERGLLSAHPGHREHPLGTSEHTQAIQLREALRRLLFANNGGELSTPDLDVLNRVARDAQVRPRFLAGGQARLEPEVAGPMGALGRIVSTVSDGMTDGSWFRLKACAEGSCRWAFYDRSKNRSGHWCSMAVCGNRSKARQFRQRQRKAGSEAPT
jgi:predicted RNA-binding Zn ribbon-like protein